LRYLRSIVALLFLLAGTSPFAFAGTLARAPHSAATTISTASTPTPPVVEPGTPVDSPDVAEWTATLIRQQRAHAVPLHEGKVRHGLARLATRIFVHTDTVAKSLTRSALRFLGTPYVFGGTSGAGFDCSGFVQHVFALLGFHLPRTADAQYYAEARASGGVQPGDLVFFETYESGPSHVGIYIGGGKFVHASSSSGVMVSALSDSYWSARYIGAKRVVGR